MGFPLADVLTSDSLVEEFACKICTELVEYTKCSYTKCGHVFCSVCLGTWMARAGTASDEARAEAALNGQNPVVGTRCPTCNTGIDAQSVSDLKTASPLAWRLLGRVKVRCPTHGTTNCQWSGDLSEVSAHLTDSKSHIGNYTSDTKAAQCGTASASQADKQQYATTNAEALKEQGNAKFAARSFKEAIQLYSKAISVAEQSYMGTNSAPTNSAPNKSLASYYGNRAAAWLHVGAAKECIEDCRRALGIDPTHAKAHLRLIKALCESSDIAGAASAAKTAVKHQPENKEINEIATTTEMLSAYLGEGDRLLAANDALGALETFTQANSVIQCASASLGVAKAEIQLGRCDRATMLTLQVIKRDAGNVAAYATRGHALCLSDDFDQGMKHLKESLRLDPDHNEAQKLFRAMKKTDTSLKKARECVAVRNFEQAEKEYTNALEVSSAPQKSPLFPIILGERGNAYLRLKRFEDALKDCDAAIESREDHKHAYYVAGNALLSLNRPSEAAERLKVLTQIDPGDETTRRHYEKAVFEVRKAKRPRYYEVLGVSSVASVPEIKQAYKQRCMQWHPDRLVNANDDEKKLAETNFKQLGEALEIMEDPMKRKLYDEGYDKEAIAERVEAARRAAHRGGHGSGSGGGGCC